MKYFYDGGLGGPFAKTGLVPLCIFQLLIGIGSTGSYAGASNAVAKSFTPQRVGRVTKSEAKAYPVAVFDSAARLCPSA